MLEVTDLFSIIILSSHIQTLIVCMGPIRERACVTYHIIQAEAVCSVCTVGLQISVIQNFREKQISVEKSP